MKKKKEKIATLGRSLEPEKLQANSVGIPELGIGRGYGTRDRFLEKVEKLSQD